MASQNPKLLPNVQTPKRQGTQGSGRRVERLRRVVGINSNPEISPSFQKRVKKTYNNHKYQYWFVATLFNVLLALQIGIAATLTAIGNINKPPVRIAIVVLGGINTFIAGLIAYLKSRNQPNRARQFREDLRRVVEAIDDAEADFLYADLDGDTRQRIRGLRELYQTARNDAAANYPELWVSSGRDELQFSTKPATGKKPAPKEVIPKTIRTPMDTASTPNTDGSQAMRTNESHVERDGDDLLRPSGTVKAGEIAHPVAKSPTQ